MISWKKREVDRLVEAANVDCLEVLRRKPKPYRKEIAGMLSRKKRSSAPPAKNETGIVLSIQSDCADALNNYLATVWTWSIN